MAYLDEYKPQKPFGIDLNYEFNTYKYIGRDYKEKNMLLGAVKFFRKKRNKNSARYYTCETFSEWKKHVRKLIPKQSEKYDDMLGFVQRKKNEASDFLKAVKVILIPIYLGLFACADKMGANTLVDYLVFVLIVTVASTLVLNNSMDKVNFYEDFLQVLKENKRK